jgi:acyl carrier protein
MVPAVTVLKALPLTASGKIDRLALPAPDRRAGQPTYVAPRTPTEVALADIWAEVLGLERIGVEDNFFELGGHSLNGLQMIAEVRDRLGVDVPVQALFEAPVIREFAEYATPKVLAL